MNKHVLVVNALAHFTGPVPVRAVAQRIKACGHTLSEASIAYELRCAVLLGTAVSNGKRTKARRYKLGE
jgi:hypothetical protein